MRRLREADTLAHCVEAGVRCAATPAWGRCAGELVGRVSRLSDWRTPPAGRSGRTTMKRPLLAIAADRRAAVRGVRRRRRRVVVGDDGGRRCSTTTAGGTPRRRRPRRRRDRGAATTAAGGAAASSNIQKPGECGMGTGEKATGDPIKIGGIATNVPGIDFTWITGMTKAYFDCVNDNGGINGRPIQYIAEDEQIDPQQIAGAGDEAHRAGRGARPRRQHEHHRLQRQQGVLRRAGLLPDHRRRRPGLLHEPELLGREHGPVLLEPRRRAGRASGPAPRARSSSSSPNQPGFDVINSGVVDFAEAERPGGRQPHRGRADRRPRRCSPRSWSRTPATAAAWCSTSPARPSCRCCRRSSSRASSTR